MAVHHGLVQGVARSLRITLDSSFLQNVLFACATRLLLLRHKDLGLGARVMHNDARINIGPTNNISASRNILRLGLGHRRNLVILTASTVLLILAVSVLCS